MRLDSNLSFNKLVLNNPNSEPESPTDFRKRTNSVLAPLDTIKTLKIHTKEQKISELNRNLSVLNEADEK